MFTSTFGFFLLAVYMVWTQMLRYFNVVTEFTSKPATFVVRARRHLYIIYEPLRCLSAS